MAAAGTIRARLNPLIVGPFMAFPIIFVIVGIGTVVTGQYRGADAAATALILVVPATALIVNFFWLYRLELTSHELSLHRFWWWGTKHLRIRQLSAVVVEPGWLRSPRIVFESPAGAVRLMPRGANGTLNFWPPRVLGVMLNTLAAQGVRVDEGAWSYLRHDAGRNQAKLSRSATVVLLALMAVMAFTFTFAVGAAKTNDPLLALALTAHGTAIAIPLYTIVAGIWWVINRWYGDLGPETVRTAPPAPGAETIPPMPPLRFFAPAYLLVTFGAAAGTGWLLGEGRLSLLLGGGLAASGAVVLALIAWARRTTARA